MSSRPFPYPVKQKEDSSFNDFIGDVLTSCVDLHRSVGQFQLIQSIPSSSSDTGSPGMFAYDDDYLYLCVDNNTWRRTAISSW